MPTATPRAVGIVLFVCRSHTVAMFRRLERYVTGIFVVALVSVGAGVVLADQNTGELAQAEHWVAHTYELMGRLSEVLSALEEAESAERGFALTGDETLLPAFERVEAVTAARIVTVRGLVADNLRQQRRADTLAMMVGQKITAMREIVSARRAAGVHAAARAIVQSAAPKHMRAVRRLVGDMMAEEQQLLAGRRRVLALSTHRTSAGIRWLGAGSLAMLGLAFLTVSGARARQRRAERRTAEMHDELRLRVAELEWRGRESEGLSQLSEALQLCLTSAEAHEAVAHIVPGLLAMPGSQGVLAVMRASRNRVERVAGWGTPAGEETLAFSPEDCCALRSGRPHVVRAGEKRLRCVHVSSDAGDYVCLPLAAHGETLGVLHVASPGALITLAVRRDGEPLSLLKEAGEHVAVALANLALRDRLKQQSIRDALTGAFNRRYLEESLDREVARARRHRRGLGLLMLDVDHFKRINDRFGHEAGDEVLRAVAEVLLRGVRGEDVVCRYGGEEFAILLPDITLEAARMRAQVLVDALRALRVAHRGEGIGRVTASVGVAVYPEHGEEGAELVRRADAALYEAKRAGRDRVVASAEESAEASAEPTDG